MTQTAYAKATNSDAQDRFGTDISLTGNRLLTGAPYEQSQTRGIDGNENDNSGTAVGAAYLYERIGGAWTTGHYLKASNADDGDSFGSSVASTEVALAVGAPGEQSLSGDQSDNSGSQVGAVYLFDPDVAGSPVQSGYIKASNLDDGDAFGGAIALEGNRMLVGARFEAGGAAGVNGDETDNSLANAGAAYLFETDGIGNFIQTAYLKASNPDSGSDNQFGNAAALSGSTLAIGAWQEDSGATGIDGDQTDTSQPRSGAVYVFDQAEDGSWSQTAYIKASNTGQNHRFGTAVAIDGNRLIVGAPGENTGEQNSGAVYVFQRDDENRWSQEAMLKPSVTGLNDLFGSRVALAGDLLAAGAPGERSDSTGLNGSDDNQSAPDSGAVYLYEHTDAGTWNQFVFVKASNTDPGDRFGSAVGLSEDTLVVGAPGEQSAAEGITTNESDNSLNDAGATYIIQ